MYGSTLALAALYDMQHDIMARRAGHNIDTCNLCRRAIAFKLSLWINTQPERRTALPVKYCLPGVSP